MVCCVVPYLIYSYKFKREVPLLDEMQWQAIEPLVNNIFSDIKEFRQKTGCSLDKARKKSPAGQTALLAYFLLAGLRLEYPEQLFDVRMLSYGRLCPNCDKPFRTTKAKFCAECGYKHSNGEKAGPIDPQTVKHKAVNQKLFFVFYEGTFLGHSRLEFGDAPMAVAHGTFIPSDTFLNFRMNNPPTEGQDISIWEGFTVIMENGVVLECKAGVSIINYGSVDNPFEMELSCLGVTTPSYTDLFPHHVVAYEASF